MVLSIKLKDNIIIPTDAEDSFWLGNSYFEAEKLLTKPYFDKECFKIFMDLMFKNFKVINAYNLYYLTDSLSIAQSIKSNSHRTINYLHFFGFKIKNYPNKSQIAVLEKMKTSKIIEYYWIENKTEPAKINIPKKPNLPEPPPETIDLSRIPKNNFYAIELALHEQNMRGKGATIIDFEDTGVDKISDLANANPYLSHFSTRIEGISRVGGANVDGADFEHQLRTLVTLFAKTPENEEFQVDGLATDAALDICTVRPILNDDYLGTVRKNLAELLNSERRNAILLFEFEVEVVDGTQKKDEIPPRFPILIFKDIASMLTDLVKNKNFIVVVAAGNSNFDFDTLKNAPWKLNTQTFNDLSKNHPDIIVIGATTKENNDFIKAPFNQSNSFDAYLYTNFFVGTRDRLKYEGTSAAAAIAAGIITCLQGKALSENKVLTTKIIKNVFKKTFKKDFPNIILTPTTLEDLWKVCEEEMESKHQ